MEEEESPLLVVGFWQQLRLSVLLSCRNLMSVSVPFFNHVLVSSIPLSAMLDKGTTEQINLPHLGHRLFSSSLLLSSSIALGAVLESLGTHQAKNTQSSRGLLCRNLRFRNRESNT